MFSSSKAYVDMDLRAPSPMVGKLNVVLITPCCVEATSIMEHVARVVIVTENIQNCAKIPRTQKNAQILKMVEGVDKDTILGIQSLIMVFLRKVYHFQIIESVHVVRPFTIY